MNHRLIKLIGRLCWLAPCCLAAVQWIGGVRTEAAAPPLRDYHFDGNISRAVLENYLSRSITMEGLLNGRGDLDDNIRMLKSIGAKFIGRSICLWGGEANLLRNFERAKQQVPKVLAADPEIVLQACVFEIVSSQAEQVPVPDWAFAALGQPVEKRNFRYTDMIYPEGQRRNWGGNASVPDVSRPETKLWFYFLARSYIDLGFEAIHFGQVEIMNKNDRDNAGWQQVLTLARSYAATHARRHLLLCDGHVPTGGLVREGRLLLDFHSFPLRIMEVPEKPQEAILKVGFSDGIYGRSKGGLTPSGWKCEHLPYLVEIDNWGVSRQPGQAKAGGIWIWGYDEVSWFANQSKPYRADWLRYARDWVQHTDPNGHLQMPGSRTVSSPLNNLRWYYANTPSKAVPDGSGDEEAIGAIWAADSAKPEPGTPKLPGISAAMEAAVAARDLSGAVTVVVTKDKVVHLDATGLANLAAKKPMRPDSVFWIASMTKPITAVSVLMLQDEGKLRVTDPIAKHIPEFAGLKTPSGQLANLTIAQVLTHTSGLGEANAAAARNAHTLADLIPLFLAAPMQYEPGAKWQYTQSGINVAARIVEIESGLSFDAFVQKRICDPLGMNNTTFYPAEKLADQLVVGYSKNRTTGELEPSAPLSGFGVQGRPPLGNGGLFSTGPDYARFCQMLLAGGSLDGKHYLSPEAMKLLMTVQTGDLPTGFLQSAEYGNRGTNYGWGIGTCILRAPHPGVAAMLSPGTFGHGGAWGTQAWVDPVRGVAYVLMVQRPNSGNSDASEIRRVFQQTAVDALSK
jgi:CubicO group peptidase (beta-lactamase class C family)